MKNGIEFKQLEDGRWFLAVTIPTEPTLTIQHIYEKRPWLSRELQSGMRYAVNGRESLFNDYKMSCYDKLVEDDWKELRRLISSASTSPKNYMEREKYGTTYYSINAGEQENFGRRLLIDKIEGGWFFGEEMIEALLALKTKRAFGFMVNYDNEYYQLEEITVNGLDYHTAEPLGYSAEEVDQLITKLSATIKEQKEIAVRGEVERKKAEIARLQAEIE